MGEYATYDGESIKIGTCEDMYYLRYDQRNAVIPKPGNVDPAKDADRLWFRLPRREEENQKPGSFEFIDPFGVKPLRFRVKSDCVESKKEQAQIALECAEKTKHTVNGLTVSVPCYHGERGPLPEGMEYSEDFDDNPNAIVAVSIRDGKAKALVGCLTCKIAYLIVDRDEMENLEPLYEKEREDWEYLLRYMEKMEEDR